MRKFIFLLFISFSITVFSQSVANKAVELIDQMIETNKTVKTLSFNTIMRERIKGKMVDKNTFFKIQVSPRKVYLRQSFIGIKLEGLYLDGSNNNELLVSTIGFPWVEMSIDPRGKTARDKHHHTLLEAGFGYFISVVSSLKVRNIEQYEKICAYQGLVEKDKRQCHKIIFDNPTFSYNYYEVKNGEQLPTIANNLLVNDYMILEKNSSISGYNDVKAGQKIIVPNSYAKKMLLYLDKDLFLPIAIEVYDDQGLYAEYLYSDLKVNPVFQSDEFSASFKGYKFKKK